jgi:hypothetical protein
MALTLPSGSIDRQLSELRGGAERWILLRPAEKAALLRELRTGVSRVAPRWVAAAARAKGIAGTALEGEEWISGPWAVLYGLNRYVDTLDQIARDGSPKIDPKRVRTRADGQVVVDVFPANVYDSLLLRGVRAEVWMQPGVSAETLGATLAPWYREPAHSPRVALVLGAGNIASIPPLDVLYKLVADGAVCALKMNPVNEYLAPFLEEAFAALVERDFLRFVHGDANVGRYLCAHPGVDEIHVTGSAATHRAIAGGEGRGKPITSELGNVSPTIVVPGNWSASNVRLQAENIVTQKLHNGGFNCIAAQVLIVPKGWPTTGDLLQAIERVMKAASGRPAYYPGAAERAAKFTKETPPSIVAADPDEEDAIFRTEAFAGVLGVVALTGDGEAFLERATAFANERLWGTLGANLIVDPATLRRRAPAIDRCIAALRYGCIGVNAWTGVGYFITETPWGAYPGHTLDDIGSGIGVVHNSHLFSRSQKSVVYAPFVPFPKPPWFVTNRNSAEIGKALCGFEVNKNPLTAATIAIRAIRG